MEEDAENASADEDLQDSALGTKEFWDERYHQELGNFLSHGDEGEIWFGKAREKCLVDYVLSLQFDKSMVRIVDLGAGNGSLLRRLRQLGFTRLTGVDFSSAAVELARRVQQASGGTEEIQFRVSDLIADVPDPTLCGQFDVVLDKGTWDAISLAGDREERLRRYRRSICACFDKSRECEQEDGTRPLRYFVIDSCNFTRDELIAQFTCAQLAFHAEIPGMRGSFTFAGKCGSTNTAVAFQFVQSTNESNDELKK